MEHDDRPWEALPPETHDALVPHLPAVADAIIEAIRSEVPAYSRPLEGAFGEGVRRGVQGALDQFVEMATNPGAGRPAGRDFYMLLGRGEVREGRSLEALLAAYRIGARVAWRRLAEAGLQEGLEPHTLVLLAESIFAYIDELSAESAEGFAREQAELAGEAERRRRVLLDLLLSVPPPDPSAATAAADAAHWPLPRELAALVWSADAAAEPARRLPLDAIVVRLDGVQCALVPDPAAPGRRDELARAVEGTPAGLGSVVAWPDTAESLRRAEAALSLARDRETAGLVAADEHRAALVLRAERRLIDDLALDRLAPLAGETERSRARLTETLRAWLRHDGSVSGAAEELHLHPQTVRYRLGRLRQLFGPALDDPDARFELELVLRGVLSRT